MEGCRVNPATADKHSVVEYVRDMAHTNGMESFWATIERAARAFPTSPPRSILTAPFRNLPPITISEHDTIDIMAAVAEGGMGKCFRYACLRHSQQTLA